MPRQNSGTYQPPAGTSAVNGAIISPSAYNTLEADLGAEITNSLDRRGRGGMLGQLLMGGFSIENLGLSTSTTGAARRDEVAAVQSDADTNAANIATLQTSLTALTSVVGSAIGSLAFFLTNASNIGGIWYRLDTQAISRTGFPGLFALIGTTYGVGDGSTTFNLPGVDGLFFRALDTKGTVDPTNPRAIGSIQQDQIQDHEHGGPSQGSLTSNVQGGGLHPIQLDQATPTSNPITGNHGSETRPKNIAFPMYVKAL